MTCNICGGSTFAPGPGKRLSATGQLPLCMSCHSLERHRTLRRFYDRFRASFDISRWTCLQVSDDRCIEPSWFAGHVVSIYGGSNSLDIQCLTVATGQFDCVVCNHVLEHVQDDRRAMAELYRVVSDQGFVQIGVPDPIRLKVTDDWGYPRLEDHGHYRRYGADIVEKLRSVIVNGTLVEFVERDPVTDMDDVYFVLTRSREIPGALKRLYPNAHMTCATDGKGRENSATPAWSAAVRGGETPPFLHGSFALKDPRRFDRYVLEGGHRCIEGWVTDEALGAVVSFNALQQRRGVSGHVCEIGVHHGRYAIALSLLRGNGERTLAIDVFDKQELNVDRSGKGDLGIFKSNVEAWLGHDHDVGILQGDSLTISGADIVRELQGRVRLFSIDGCHTCAHTLNDLRIAEECLADGGLVILDDFLNPAWPGVLEAVVRYLDHRDGGSKLAPIGYGNNKFYLTTPGSEASYGEQIANTFPSHLQQFKHVRLCGKELTYFSTKPISTFLCSLKLDLGQTAYFRKDGVARSGMIGAWSEPEEFGCWTTGHWAGMALDLGDSEHRSRLAFKLASFRAGCNVSPKIDVFVFNDWLQTIQFSAERNVWDGIIEIDRRKLGQDSRVEVWFHTKELVSPAQIGLSRDDRKLAFFAVSIHRIR